MHRPSWTRVQRGSSVWFNSNWISPRLESTNVCVWSCSLIIFLLSCLRPIFCLVSFFHTSELRSKCFIHSNLSAYVILVHKLSTYEHKDLCTAADHSVETASISLCFCVMANLGNQSMRIVSCSSCYFRKFMWSSKPGYAWSPVHLNTTN